MRALCLPILTALDDPDGKIAAEYGDGAHEVPVSPSDDWVAHLLSHGKIVAGEVGGFDARGKMTKSWHVEESLGNLFR